MWPGSNCESNPEKRQLKSAINSSALSAAGWRVDRSAQRGTLHGAAAESVAGTPVLTVVLLRSASIANGADAKAGAASKRSTGSSSGPDWNSNRALGGWRNFPGHFRRRQIEVSNSSRDSAPVSGEVSSLGTGALVARGGGVSHRSTTAANLRTGTALSP